MTSSQFVRLAVAYASRTGGKIHSCWSAENRIQGCGQRERAERLERWTIVVEGLRPGASPELREKMARSVGLDLQVVDGRDRLMAWVLVRVGGPVRSQHALSGRGLEAKGTCGVFHS